MFLLILVTLSFTQADARATFFPQWCLTALECSSISGSIYLQCPSGLAQTHHLFMVCSWKPSSWPRACFSAVSGQLHFSSLTKPVVPNGWMVSLCLPCPPSTSSVLWKKITFLSGILPILFSPLIPWEHFPCFVFHCLSLSGSSPAARCTQMGLLWPSGSDCSSEQPWHIHSEVFRE